MAEELELFVPGRVCLFGEHSDWAGAYCRINGKLKPGRVIITGTNQGIYARVRLHRDSLIIRSTLQDGTALAPHRIPMKKDALQQAAEKGDFFSYAAGVALQILTHYHVRGIEMDNYKTDLPLKKGLSSSAAICVLTARAFNRLYDLKMTVRGEMESAYQGEIATPSRCGRMDQGCAFGRIPIQMTFRGDSLTVEELGIGGDVHMLLVDLHGEKDTVRILSDLNRCYPFAQEPLHERVQECLGPTNWEITGKACRALEEGNARELGELMTRAQQLFDESIAPACPSQLQSPGLHRLLSHPAIQRHIWGGKGVGSQGDGSAQLVARSPESRQEASRIIRDELGMNCLDLDIHSERPVRKAVIPVAGFGTRMFPASKAVKKELFPIITREGIAKPIILPILEEAVHSGIEQVCLVVRKGDEPFFQEFLHEPIPVEHYNRLPQSLKEYDQKLRELGRKVSFVAQETQDGFGHAVYCAREWVGGEPFLLMLGDHLYMSDTDVSCARQLLEAYRRTRGNIVAVRRTPEHLVQNFGTVAGRWLDEEQTLLEIEEFAEKPTPDYARNNLRVPGLPEGEYLCLFGQYVLSPDVFHYIEEHIRANLRERGEFQLTSALDRLRRDAGFRAYVVKGRRYDTGLPQAYLETLNAFYNEGR